METLLVNVDVKEDGIFLNPELLTDFKNNKVQIIIRKLKENDLKSAIMQFAGKLSNEESNAITDSVEECRGAK